MDHLLFHIDSRCIHGQIVAGWGVQRQVKRFLLANDQVVADEWERNQYLSTPGSEFETFVTGIEEAIRLLRTWQDKRQTMLIVSSPHDALRIFDGGIVHELVTVGNLDPGPDKRSLSASVFVDEQEQRDLLELMRRGVQVLIQPLPRDKPVILAEVLKTDQ